jgi:UDP-N-acetylglucosamine 2-epimerase (non-hydrolysing)
VAGALSALDAIFERDRPAVVVVQGDTNATLAGALAANAHRIPLVHVEAGLRSNDREMPEEHNRVVTDHLADVLCAATAGNVENLAKEGITKGVHVTGNTVVEAVARQLLPAADRKRIVANHGLVPDGYVLATVHRPENTDHPRKLRALLGALGSLGLPVVLPLHPRTRRSIERFGFRALLDPLYVTEPLGGGEFLSLAAHAALLVSDSGGIQEECTVLKRPLLVVRRSTERPESMPAFARLVQPEEVADAARQPLADPVGVHRALTQKPSPYGDGRASDRITSLVRSMVRPLAGAPA